MILRNDICIRYYSESELEGGIKTIDYISRFTSMDTWIWTIIPLFNFSSGHHDNGAGGTGTGAGANDCVFEEKFFRFYSEPKGNKQKPQFPPLIWKKKKWNPMTSNHYYSLDYSFRSVFVFNFILLNVILSILVILIQT